MSIGTFYSLSPKTEPLFRKARSKGDWYQAMHEAGVSDAPSLRAEDSMPAWEYSIGQAKLPSPLGRLFIGDLQAEADSTGDPEVAYHTSASVRSIATDLVERGEQGLRGVLAASGHESDSWFYKPLLRFFEQAEARQEAIVILWGN